MLYDKLFVDGLVRFSWVGGVSYDALLYGSYADQYPHSVPDTVSPSLYLSFGGLGFLKGYVLDSYFTYVHEHIHCIEVIV